MDRRGCWGCLSWRLLRRNKRAPVLVAFRISCVPRGLSISNYLCLTIDNVRLSTASAFGVTWSVGHLRTFKPPNGVGSRLVAASNAWSLSVGSIRDRSFAISGAGGRRNPKPAVRRQL